MELDANLVTIACQIHVLTMDIVLKQQLVTSALVYNRIQAQTVMKVREDQS